MDVFNTKKVRGLEKELLKVMRARDKAESQARIAESQVKALLESTKRAHERTKMYEATNEALKVENAKLMAKIGILEGNCYPHANKLTGTYLPTLLAEQFEPCNSYGLLAMSVWGDILQDKHKGATFFVFNTRIDPDNLQYLYGVTTTPMRGQIILALVPAGRAKELEGARSKDVYRAYKELYGGMYKDFNVKLAAYRFRIAAGLGRVKTSDELKVIFAALKKGIVQEGTTYEDFKSRNNLAGADLKKFNQYTKKYFGTAPELIFNHLRK